MKIAVMGAGAVGCYYGAMLARAGHEVTLVARPHHVAAITESGLVLETSAFTETVAVAATTEASGVVEAELILFSVKSDDTPRAGIAMAPHLSPRATILSLQNGVDNADRLQQAIARSVIATAVYVAAEIPRPGHVRHNGGGKLILGQGPASAKLATIFERAGIPAAVSEDVGKDLWEKLIINCAYNALSAIPQLPYGQMMRTEGVVAAMEDVVRECRAVAAASGVRIDEAIIGKVLGLAAAMPEQYSSTAQDLRNGKPTEIHHLNGYVVRLGERVGVDAPVNRLLALMVRLMEGRSLNRREFFGGAS